jgi:hypothetical protein
MIKKIAVFCIIFLFAALLQAAEKVSVSLDKDKAYIGDVVNLKAVAQIPENASIAAQQKISFNDFDIAGYDVKHLSAVPNVYEINFKIAAYKTGVLAIEPVGIHYIDAQGADGVFYTPETKLEILSVLSGAQDDNIKDIKPLQKLKIKTVYVILIVIVVFGFLIIAALLLKDITKKKELAAIAAAVLTPQEKALKNLNELYEAYKNEAVAVKLFYYKMSEILRTYVSEKYGFNALEMTTSEFFSAAKKNLPESVNVNEFKNYLKVFSLARYAGFKPSDIEIENNFKYTKNLLELL